LSTLVVKRLKALERKHWPRPDRIVIWDRSEEPRPIADAAPGEAGHYVLWTSGGQAA